MADNAQKTPFVNTNTKFVVDKNNDASQIFSKALPATVTAVSGSIVTVAFQVTGPYTLPKVTMPLFGPEYVRYPIQVGDKGFTIPCDVFLGGMSGLGTSTADLTQRGNLASLAFMPIGNKNWTTVDPNAVTIYGPNGVVLRDTGNASSVILLPAGVAVVGRDHVNITCGSASIQMTPGNITITDSTAHTSPAVMNAAWNSFISFFNSHIHSNGNAGGNTGVPTSPYTGGNIAP